VLCAQLDTEYDVARSSGQDHLAVVIVIAFHSPNHGSMCHHRQPPNGASSQQLVWVHVDTSLSLLMHSPYSPTQSPPHNRNMLAVDLSQRLTISSAKPPKVPHIERQGSRIRLPDYVERYELAAPRSFGRCYCREIGACPIEPRCPGILQVLQPK